MFFFFFISNDSRRTFVMRMRVELSSRAILNSNCKWFIHNSTLNFFKSATCIKF